MGVGHKEREGETIRKKGAPLLLLLDHTQYIHVVVVTQPFSALARLIQTTSTGAGKVNYREGCKNELIASHQEEHC